MTNNLTGFPIIAGSLFDSSLPSQSGMKVSSRLFPLEWYTEAWNHSPLIFECWLNWFFNSQLLVYGESTPNEGMINSAAVYKCHISLNPVNADS